MTEIEARITTYTRRLDPNPVGDITLSHEGKGKIAIHLGGGGESSVVVVYTSDLARAIKACQCGD